MAALFADRVGSPVGAVSGTAVGVAVGAAIVACGVGATVGVGCSGVAVGSIVGVDVETGGGGLVSTTAGSEAGPLGPATGAFSDAPEEQAAAVTQSRTNPTRAGVISRNLRGISVISVSYLCGVAALYDPHIWEVLFRLGFLPRK